jgi:hypothetical protein
MEALIKASKARQLEEAQQKQNYRIAEDDGLLVLL